MVVTSIKIYTLNFTLGNDILFLKHIYLANIDFMLSSEILYKLKK